MVSTMNARKRGKPVPGLKLPYQEVDWSKFSRAQIGEILGGIHPSMISRYAEVFEGIDPYVPIPRDRIWEFYVFRCWKMFHPNGWRDTFLKDKEELGEDAFLEKYVLKIGGSRQHCEDLIENYIAKQSTEKLIA